MIKGLIASAVLLVGISAQAGLQDYAGSYSGKFDGTKGNLVIGVSGNSLTAEFVAMESDDNGVLGGACGATIGNMLKMDIDDGTEIDSAVFSFDAGNCTAQVQGRQFTVDFKHKNGMPVSAKASVFERTETVWETECYPSDPWGGVHCRRVPRTYNWYSTGKFKK